MKKDIIQSIKITFAFCLFFAFFALILWGYAQAFTSNKGKAEVVLLHGKVVGASNIGQNFTKKTYFWGRPSAVNYKADASCGSNKGPSNEAYLKDLKLRVDTFLLNHPYLKKSEVPAEMITASGSGLDPDITPQSALVQIKRVAEARNLSEAKVKVIVEKQIEKPILGLFGPEKINVLKLNVELEKTRQP